MSDAVFPAGRAMPGSTPAAALGQGWRLLARAAAAAAQAAGFAALLWLILALPAFLAG